MIQRTMNATMLTMMARREWTRLADNGMGVARWWDRVRLGSPASCKIPYRPCRLVRYRFGNGTFASCGSILFTVALPALTTTDNKLVSTAGVLTAIFGYGGTSIILFDENPILFALVWLYHFYLIFFAFALAVTSRWIRRIFTKLRS